MADYPIVLRAGETAPADIVGYPLDPGVSPVADIAIFLSRLARCDSQPTTAITLHAGEVSPSDIVCYPLASQVVPCSVGQEIVLVPFTGPSLAAEGGGTFSIVGAGGVRVSGVGTIQKTAVLVASGGALVSGAADLSRGRSILGSGGVQAGGQADFDLVELSDVFGGANVGGFALFGATKAITGSGGVQVGGAADLALVANVAGSGGVLVGGQASIAFPVSVIGSGGVSVGGTATIGTFQAGASTTGTARRVRGNRSAVPAPSQLRGEPIRSWKGPLNPRRSVHVMGSGGVTVGGLADVQVVAKNRATVVGGGGVFVAGQATLKASRHVSGFGGVGVGGSADQVKVQAVGGSGGSASGGDGLPRGLRRLAIIGRGTDSELDLILSLDAA